MSEDHAKTAQKKEHAKKTAQKNQSIYEQVKDMTGPQLKSLRESISILEKEILFEEKIAQAKKEIGSLCLGGGEEEITPDGWRYDRTLGMWNIQIRIDRSGTVRIDIWTESSRWEDRGVSRGTARAESLVNYFGDSVVDCWNGLKVTLEVRRRTSEEMANDLGLGLDLEVEL